MIDHLPERLRRRIQVEEPSGCWMWTGAVTHGRSTYGIAWCSVAKATTMAHRAIYAALVEPIPAGVELDHHTCKRPLCVNPRHVTPVTPAENKRRERRRLCRRGLHRMVASNMRGSKRACRTCDLERKRRRDRRLIRQEPNQRLAPLGGRPVQLQLF